MKTFSPNVPRFEAGYSPEMNGLNSETERILASIGATALKMEMTFEPSRSYVDGGVSAAENFANASSKADIFRAFTDTVIADLEADFQSDAMNDADMYRQRGLNNPYFTDGLHDARPSASARETFNRVYREQTTAGRPQEEASATTSAPEVVPEAPRNAREEGHEIGLKIARDVASELGIKLDGNLTKKQADSLRGKMDAKLFRHRHGGVRLHPDMDAAANNAEDRQMLRDGVTDVFKFFTGPRVR